jgi:hypothetical protein
MVFKGNAVPFLAIGIRIVGYNKSRHVGGSNWMFLMEGDVGE